METKYFTKEQKEDILELFLIIPKKFNKYIKNKNKIYWIYKITNIKSNKVYIGKTIDIRRRAMDYINDYCKGCLDREINKAINKHGIDNFIITPIEIAVKPESASIKEKYYIDLYDSIKNGYNTIMGSVPYVQKKKKHSSVSQTIYSKISKSKLLCALNPNNKTIIFSTGLKLFGDFVGRHKDEIKSAAKRETKIDGFFLYYMNDKDFKDQLENALHKIEKNSIYSDCNLQYKDFVSYSKYILNYINNHKNDKNFKINFITQSNDECGYKYENIDKFLEYYNKLSNKILV